MSFLAPLFFLATAAIAAPIIFHLIRREPKGRIEFSSLMFVKPSPPRVTRRSRLDNWLLLLLRSLAILLVAAAFTRPFLRTFTETTTRRSASFTVFLVDQSASMQREDLWQQALAAADQQFKQLGDSDRFAVITFDQSADVVREMKSKSEEGAQQTLNELKSLKPSWKHSDLGAAIVESIELIDETMRSADESEAERFLVVISDMQQSSKLDSIRTITWPKSTSVRLIKVAPKSPTNASLVVSSNALDSDPNSVGDDAAGIASNKSNSNRAKERFYRVKVTNSAKSGAGRFKLTWLNESGQTVKQSPDDESPDDIVSQQNRPEKTPKFGASVSGEEVERNEIISKDRDEDLELASERFLSVPPGTDRVVNLKAPGKSAIALAISGDDHAFDNQYYMIVPEPLKQRLVMLGNPISDPRDSLFYYLEKLPLSRPGRAISAALVPPAEFPTSIPDDELTPDKIPLIVVNEFPDVEQLARLKNYMSQGGKVLIVVDEKVANSESAHAALRQLSGEPSMTVAPAEVKDYAIFSRIDFTSEVFQSLADPRYSDFTKVQFWAHANLRNVFETNEMESSLAAQEDFQPTEMAPEGSELQWSVLAWFDKGAPALVRKRIGTGDLFVLAAGWQPTESQLALSTKFVPIISGVLGGANRATEWEASFVGDRINLPNSPTAELALADGTVVPFQDSADVQLIDRPGIYQWRDADQSRRFAVNMPSSESDFASLDRAVLEQLGVQFEDVRKETILADGERQKRDSELEQQQSVWRWLLLSALGLIGVETLLSSRRARGRLAMGQQASDHSN